MTPDIAVLGEISVSLVLFLICNPRRNLDSCFITAAPRSWPPVNDCDVVDVIGT